MSASTAAPTQPRPRPAAAGFTLIEVMISVVIVVTGVIGILGMQRASIDGNSSAQARTIAAQATRAWIDRIELDARNWTSNTGTGFAQGTRWISQAPTSVNAVSAWTSPTELPTEGIYQGVDWDGQPALAAEDPKYCTHIRYTWLRFNEALRVDVRTYWTKRTRGTNDLTAFTNCNVGQEADVTAELATDHSRLSAVYASVTLRWNGTGNP